MSITLQYYSLHVSLLLIRFYTESRIIQEINFSIPFSMPLPRNDIFTGREAELNKVHEYFSKSKSKSRDTPFLLALVGTGGMGKTEVALEYAYRCYAEYTAIFWISAATEDTIHGSFINILQCIIDEQ